MVYDLADRRPFWDLSVKGDHGRGVIGHAYRLEHVPFLHIAEPVLRLTERSLISSRLPSDSPLLTESAPGAIHWLAKAIRGRWPLKGPCL